MTDTPTSMITNPDNPSRTPADTGLTILKLKLDLSQGFPHQWHRNAFLSQYYNALSMSFPVGEQSFIDAVREVVQCLPETDDNALLREMVAQFIGQEATHRHLHGQYNAHLEKQGLHNHWQHWAMKRIAFGRKRGIGSLHWLAVTAAYEHCTAVFADAVLRYDSWFDGADPSLQTLWRWHAAEETEHRAVAFDLYVAAGGNYAWRIRWYGYALTLFAFDAGRQTLLNLWHAGVLFKPSTWWAAAQFFWGKDGAVWRCTGPLLAYFRRDFHPDQELEAMPELQAHALSTRWLADNADSFRVVR